MRRLVSLFLASLSFGLSSCGQLALAGAGTILPADVSSPMPVGIDENGLAIYRLIDLPYTEDLRIYRGTKSVDGEFPGAGYIGNCTAHAVQSNVIFTAGHCQATGAVIYFQHRQSGRTFRGVCTRHPQYNTQTIFNDYTLCKLDEHLPAGSVLGTLANYVPPVGTKVLLNGYGQPNPRVHHWGYSAINSFSGQDVVTCGNPSNLGPGDSGGPLLAWTDDRTARGKFEILAVNSRGNNQCDWYNMTSSAEFQSFARQYERTNNVKLCGISADCSNSEPAPPRPVLCEKQMSAVKSLRDELSVAVDNLGRCMAE